MTTIPVQNPVQDIAAIPVPIAIPVQAVLEAHILLIAAAHLQAAHLLLIIAEDLLPEVLP